ncbi:Signal transduction histidine kinase [Arcticibacter svalbardensis MN12-7]|uniref:histidine kinase n=1 Tax=Arcticibacter svalbardensis MN12-7 TaxID=1150600 RepID=R9GSI6_9SPHI|nr:response regulator [Arcticibacter svalbardensis]EOR94827.1 Signal transduction histidine kinase [Arcticibacter svalbardensis MN12-7]
MFKKFSFQNQVLAGFMLTFLIVFTVGIVSFFSIKDQVKDASWVDHTKQIVLLNNEIESHLTTAEADQRGYMITGFKYYLDDYKKELVLINPAFLKLRALVIDNEKQNINIDSLNYYATLKVEVMDNLIQGYVDGKDFKDPFMLLMFRKAIQYRGHIKVYSKRISDLEHKLLSVREGISNFSTNRTIAIIIGGCFLISCLLLVLFIYIKRTFRRQKVTEGRIKEANVQLNELAQENEKKNWFLTGAKRIDVVMRGEQNLEELSGNIIGSLAEYVEAQIGAFYLFEGKMLKIAGIYAYPDEESTQRVFGPGEGLVGQVAVNKKQILIQDIPDYYIKLSSGFGDIKLNSLLVQPVFFEEKLIGVIELGFVKEITDLKLEFITEKIDGVGASLNSADVRAKLEKLVNQTQQQAETLEAQHEELTVTNEVLKQKTHQLQASEEELTVQQEELRQSNSELEEKAEMLEERNFAVEQAREAIGVKARELEQSSKYKSEFLANMSHELRTPLNSILILAKILKDDKFKTLNADQIKYAGVIHNAGSDLLNLINDILDLSKIESGKMDIELEDVDLRELSSNMQHLFDEVARNKKIDFNCQIEKGTPISVHSDKQRMEQILKNLLSNAFKFTSEKGNVTVTIGLVEKGVVFLKEQLKDLKEDVLAIRVKDSGIGISKDKQQLIFEAFQQADGSTSRKYGGTGLGLSICRELCNLLGGEIQIESEYNLGSSFTLYLPTEKVSKVELTSSLEVITGNDPVYNSSSTMEKKNFIDDHMYTLLIIEDDVVFADILKEYAIERGFSPILAFQGDTGLQMALEHKPDAIVLDIMLPVLDGWAVLKKLKADPLTRDIPVHLMSARDETNSKAKKEGAIGFLKKPVEKDELDHAFNILIDNSGNEKIKRVLLIEDNEIQSDALVAQFKAKNIKVKQAFNGKEALAILEEDSDFYCLILDMKLPDISGVDLLERIKSDQRLLDIPVVINTAMEMDKDILAEVIKHTNAMVLKSNKSNDRLLDEVNLFMNKVKSGSNSVKIASSGNPVKNNSTLEKAMQNKTVLLVDDDMRNIYALSSALHEYEVKVEIANNGIEALKKLDEFPELNIVLMDIMMPEMDGYEAMREIRKQKRFSKLPIIALTAKAMKNDREKCLEAGANDYISKPVDMDKLLSMMRVWLS